MSDVQPHAPPPEEVRVQVRKFILAVEGLLHPLDEFCTAYIDGDRHGLCERLYQQQVELVALSVPDNLRLFDEGNYRQVMKLVGMLEMGVMILAEAEDDEMRVTFRMQLKVIRDLNDIAAGFRHWLGDEDEQRRYSEQTKVFDESGDQLLEDLRPSVPMGRADLIEELGLDKGDESALDSWLQRWRGKNRLSENWTQDADTDAYTYNRKVVLPLLIKWRDKRRQTSQVA